MTELKNIQADQLEWHIQHNDGLEQIIDFGAFILNRCYNAVSKIVGHLPVMKEIAMVNSLFLYTVKEKYFRKVNGK